MNGEVGFSLCGEETHLKDCPSYNKMPREGAMFSSGMRSRILSVERLFFDGWIYDAAREAVH
jgi:hypothetical protein